MCTRAEVDWTKVDSDHAGVQILLDNCKKAPGGPGLKRKLQFAGGPSETNTSGF